MIIWACFKFSLLFACGLAATFDLCWSPIASMFNYVLQQYPFQDQTIKIHKHKSKRGQSYCRFLYVLLLEIQSSRREGLNSINRFNQALFFFVSQLPSQDLDFQCHNLFFYLLSWGQMSFLVELLTITIYTFLSKELNCKVCILNS